MSDFEGNVHQWGDMEDYENGDGPEINPWRFICSPIYAKVCHICGHDENLHDGMGCFAENDCECISFVGDPETAEPEEVEER